MLINVLPFVQIHSYCLVSQLCKAGLEEKESD